MGRQPKPTTPFAQRLVAARGAVSRAEIAAALGCPVETLGNYERGRTFPDREMLLRLRAVLGVSLDWLLSGEDAAGGEAGSVGAAAAIDVPFLAEVADEVAAWLSEQGEAADLVRVVALAATWYNDLVATCHDDDQRRVGLRVMRRRLRQDRD